ncbi:MAG: 50S ribosomal protein L35 [Verrucomicrobia subdivision 3 bacterium]|nr:50S ribosomal protein L35 [Limisphaerales bacterium]MCS1416239.1 50S ribosomal protein L35 [Limisphaerales bacterium]
MVVAKFSWAKIALASTILYLYIARAFDISLKAMRRARNQKTRKSVAKRFKITATGKVIRNHSGKRHLLSCKSPKRRRRLGTSTVLDRSDEDRIILNLPFNRRG